jgi:PAT family beta-lactamase induction signal transducer AmpG
MSHRLLAVLFLGFSSGLPLALTSSTLQAWFTQAHISLMTIGSLSLLGIPYTLKFLWAPLMDHFSIIILGKRKGWILIMQLSVALTLLLMAQLNPISQAAQMGLIAVFIAIFSASQDVAIDAYRTDVLLPAERGLGATYYVFAYRIALLLSGGLALVCADYVGWKITYELMAILILLSMLPAYKAPNVEEISCQTSNVLQTMRMSLYDLLRRDKILILILFVIFYKFGDALALSLMTNFLLQGLGFSLTEVGLAYKVVSFVATLLGGLIGGMLLLKWNIYRALLFFGLAQAFSNLVFVALAIIGKNFLFMALAIFIENFCSGLSTAAFLAFLMSLCNHRYTASQYALLSAIASLGRVLLGPVAAILVQRLGWVEFYIWGFILCFPGIIFLLFLKNKVFDYATLTAH